MTCSTYFNKDFTDSMLEGFSNEEEAGKKYKSKNLDAERRRRCRLNSKLLTLRTLVPNITKMSKESTLVDAVDYIQNLRKQINDLKLELSSIPDTNKDKQVSSSSSECITPELLFQCPAKEAKEISAAELRKILVEIVGSYEEI